MLESKVYDTPCFPYNMLFKDDVQPYGNPALYRSIVDELQYLIFARPNIAFSMHQVCQFVQSPIMSHFTVVNRIFKVFEGHHLLWHI